MSRLALIFLLILILLFPAQALAHSQIVVIEMTTDGFKPREATVDQNATVIFKNEDSKERWPASNLHPTHEIYPEFDPEKPVKTGESWVFKPQKVGVWKYHDHLNPHMRATLIVESEEGQVQSEPQNIFTGIIDAIKSWFSNFNAKFSKALSYQKQTKALSPDQFLALSAKEQFKALEDMPDSWEYVKSTFSGKPGSSGNIHDLAHFSGGQLYEKLGFDGLSKCSPEFAFGCFHGFLDTAFKKDLSNIKKAEESCKSLGVGGPFASCIHGIGHGIASFYQTADIRSSLSSCRQVNSGIVYCFDGVLMEFERSAPLSFYSKDNPYYPCDEIEEQFGTQVGFACGRNQPTVLMSKFNFSFEEVINICINAKSDQFKIACFDALGFILSRGNSDPRAIAAGCRKAPVDEFMLRCTKAGAGELIFQEVPGWQEKAPQTCNLLPPNFQGDCHNYIQNLRMEYAR